MSANTASSPNRRQHARNGEKHHESHHGYSDGVDRGGHVSRLRGVGQVSRLLLEGGVSMITRLKEPIIDEWRETHIDYSERLGEASKSISIETVLTFGELLALCRSLLGVGNDSA